MNYQDKIKKTVVFVKETLEGAEAGHDWFHVERVWKWSIRIAEKENQVDDEVVSLSALLHDIADPKFHDGDESIAIRMVTEFLKEINVAAPQSEQIIRIISKMSFKNRREVDAKEESIEFKIVQDADRLDAIGAMGIARAFNFGGYKNNLMYHPDILPQMNKTKEEYKKSQGTTINHFYEKLLLMKDTMHTSLARQEAEKRHDYMLSFLKQFYAEWEVR